MAILSLERAVVRLQSYEKNRLMKNGTAWFITPDLLLTAAHCVGERRGAGGRRYEGPFLLELPRAAGAPASPPGAVEVEVVRESWALDAALLRLKAPLPADPQGPQRLSTLPLGKLPPGTPARERWYGYGFPVAHPTGLHPDGEIKSTKGNVEGQPALELSCDIGGVGDLEGLSGGPVCAGGLAVGLIRYGTLKQLVIHATAIADICAAFTELAAITTGEASFAPPPPPPDPDWLPQPPGRYYFGREKELAELRRRMLQLGGGRGIDAVYGPTGVGKSELARRYVQVHRGAYSAVFWLRPQGADQLRQSLLRLHDYLVQAQAQPWLLVIDQADPQQLAPLLYLIEGDGNVLVTTRAQDCSSIGVIPAMELSHFCEEDAVGFLERRVQRTFTTEERADAVELARALFCFPEILDKAGEQIFNGFPLDKYLEAVRKDPGSPFKMVLDLSIKECTQRAPLVPELLDAAALLGREPIPVAFFQSGTAPPDTPLGMVAQDPRPLFEALDALSRTSLIRRDGDAFKDPLRVTFTVKPMVQALRESEMDVERARGRLRDLAEAARRVLGDAAGGLRHDLCAQLLPHVRRLALQMQLHGMPAADVLALLERAADALRDLGYLEEAQLFMREITRIHESVLQDAQGSMVVSLGRLGLVEQKRGRHDEARACFRRALQLCQASEGEVFSSRAEVLYRSVFGHLKEAMYPAELASALAGLARVLCRQGQDQAAAALFEEIRPWPGGSPSPGPGGRPSSGST